jgi:uncharacterized membrane protein
VQLLAAWWLLLLLVLLLALSVPMLAELLVQQLHVRRSPKWAARALLGLLLGPWLLSGTLLLWLLQLTLEQQQLWVR